MFSYFDTKHMCPKPLRFFTSKILNPHLLTNIVIQANSSIQDEQALKLPQLQRSKRQDSEHNPYNPEAIDNLYFMIA